MRAVRAALFAVICVDVSASLHGVANRGAVTWGVLALGVAALWPPAYALLGRERRAAALTAGLAACQAGLHVLFTCLGAAGPAPGGVPGTATAMAPDMPGMAMPTGAAHPTAAAMLSAHALAVLICGRWLRQGERALFELCHTAALLAAAPLRRLRALAAVLAAGSPVTPPVRRAPAGRVDFSPRRHSTPMLTAVTFRGPPATA